MFLVTRVTKRIDRSWHLQQNQPYLVDRRSPHRDRIFDHAPPLSQTFPLSRTDTRSSEHHEKRT